MKVDPSAIFNFSAGYSFIAGASVLRPELYIENLFDKKYLLKAAFFSGPRWDAHGAFSSASIWACRRSRSPTSDATCYAERAELVGLIFA
ncbi:MAG TPA: hypothetical protein VH539_23275 [Gemmatimonadaceae bacterium]